MMMWLPVACSRTPEKPRNLLLITVDTLRPDRLGVGGNERRTSPAIDRLAAEGLTFSRAYSQAGWTLPSVATLLTGRYPRDHGAIRFDTRLKASLPTLASTLADQGYDTRAFVSHVVLRRRSGLAHGFGAYDDSVLDVGHPHKVSTAEPLTEAAITSLDSIVEPFFLWVHYFDPHSNYLKHPEWDHFGSRPIDRYDGEIAHTDRQIGRLLEEFQRRDLDPDTVVVFTADHGETFRERQGRFHFTHHEEVIRVPLIVRAPGLPPAIRGDIAEQIDLLPTVLSLLGIEPPAGLPGRDLSQPPEADARQQPSVFVERDRPAGFVQRTVIEGRYKLTMVEPTSERAVPLRRDHAALRPGRFFFDLQNDPGEIANLYDEADPRVEAMEARLRHHFATPTTVTTEVTIDDVTRQQLESLGYLP